jgi:DNA-directed RNA polymerase subunit N (RpoN/RPB10)
MVHTKCKTCGNPLSKIEFGYKKQVDEICNNQINNEEEQKNKISELIKSYNLPMCCNIKLLTSINLAEIIVQNFND